MRARLVALDSLPARLGSLTVREYEPGDEHAILATFNRVFAAADPTFRPRSLASWRWRFADNPSGSRILLVWNDEGRLVGHLASMNQRARIEGQPTIFGQAVDQMYDPGGGGLRRSNPLGVLNNSFYRLYGGWGPDQLTIGFGVPVPAAWRSGKAFARYEVVRTLQKLWARIEDVRANPRPHSGLALEEVGQFPPDVDELFERVAPHFGAIAVRDRAQLDWRWVANRERRSRIGLVRREGDLVGYAVLTRGSFDGCEGLGLVGDWLVLREEPEAGVLLRDWLRRAGEGAGLARLELLVPDNVREWTDFQEAGFRVAPTQYFLTAKACFRVFDARWLERSWYYTLGDTDLI